MNQEKTKKLYVLVEFPYPSGEGLHLGHSFTMTGADVYARKKRMEGWRVMFPMGWDAFGLPTENYAIRTGIHPKIVTKRNTDNFRRQMKKMAFSFDWEREINTTDPAYYKWTQWIFLQFFKHGLAYKQKMPINWCPACKIGLANEEVIDNRCERCGAEVEEKELDQWLLKITAYADRLIDDLKLVDFPESTKAAQINWIGRSKGAKVEFKIAGAELKTEKLEVFTTRPDTLWGATFMVVAPEHKIISKLKARMSKQKRKGVEDYIEKARKKSDSERTQLTREKTGVFTGLYVINPVNNQKIPVWISDFVLVSYGTGAIMAVPAHDQRDWKFAKKFNLPIIPVVEPPQKWDFDKGAWEAVDQGKMINSGPINGLSPKQAIQKTIQLLKKMGAGQKAVSYHLRDWIFSRQHYWGEPIPMIYCPACAKKGISWWDTAEGKAFLNSKSKIRSARQDQNFNDQNSKKKKKGFEYSDLFRILNFDIQAFESLAGWFPIPEEQLPLELPEVEKYQPTETGESPLANIKNWVETTCPYCGKPAKRETDTMPNWAGSSWYFLRYCDPKNEKEFASFEKLEKWLPVDIYFGGAEHTTLHLLYSRFWHKFLYDLGKVPCPEPYQKRIVHGVILGADGQRMSKSKGNVVSPDEIWQKYSVDALRTYLMFIGPFEGTMTWNQNALKGVVRFLAKVRKLVIRAKEGQEEKQEVKILLNQLIKKVSQDIDRFQYNTAVAAMMETTNQLLGVNDKLSKDSLKSFLKLLAPFAPYTSQELWQDLGEKGNIHQAEWPKVEEKYLMEEEVEVAVQVEGKTRGKIKVKREKLKMKNYVAKKAQEDLQVAKHLVGKKIRKVIFVPARLINFVMEEGD